MTKILVPRSIFADIQKHGTKWAPGLERGGLLLGYRKPDALEITLLTFPGRWDHATPTQFRRSERGHRVRALREWVQSKGIVDWVGEWHTHPGGLAQPSFTDRRNWKQLARHVGRPMGFLIIAGSSHYLGLQPSMHEPVTKLLLQEADDEFILYS